MNSPSPKPLKLTDHQVALLRECSVYSIMEDCDRAGRIRYYRLGGHGHAPIRFVRTSLVKLRDLGLVTDYRATQKGREYLASLNESHA